MRQRFRRFQTPHSDHRAPLSANCKSARQRIRTSRLFSRLWSYRAGERWQSPKVTSIRATHESPRKEVSRQLPSSGANKSPRDQRDFSQRNRPPSKPGGLKSPEEIVAIQLNRPRRLDAQAPGLSRPTPRDITASDRAPARTQCPLISLVVRGFAVRADIQTLALFVFGDPQPNRHPDFRTFLRLPAQAS